MSLDTRLSGILHVLLHMAEHRGPVTSEVLARAMHTNPVVVRRVMAGLREQGLVSSTKGHGGGWTIACDMERTTLRQIYEAVGSPALIALGNRSERPTCLVEQAVNAALDETFAEAEALMLERLGGVSLAALSADFHARMVRHGHSIDHHHHHDHDHDREHSK
jgi:DNA-binding IscR family transcriptional regulator